MERLQNKKCGWVSQSICAEKYIVIGRCIWKHSQEVHWDIWTWFYHFLSVPGLAWQACLNKTEIELELLTDIDMLLIIEREIQGGICHTMHQYGKANNKYITDYNKDEESSYSMYWDANNLYGWWMSQKLPVHNFKWEKTSKFDGSFMKNYNENSEKGYMFEVDVELSRNLNKDLPFLPKRMKIKKYQKPMYNLSSKEKFIVHVRALKQALNHGLSLRVMG